MISKQRTRLQKELSNWLGEDVMDFIVRAHQHDGMTYRQIAADLSSSGYRVKGTTISGWVSYERRHV